MQSTWGFALSLACAFGVDDDHVSGGRGYLTTRWTQNTPRVWSEETDGRLR